MISPDFSPWSGLAGGLMIGLAATLLLAFNGRIAGVSGILSAITERWNEESGWKLAFLVGLLSGPFLFMAFTGSPAQLTLQAEGPSLLVAGLLVGFGTRLGGGCTSGHGVCGIARGSARSITATAVFMASAIATVFILRHVF